jgi:tRNA modification GTPase
MALKGRRQPGAPIWSGPTAATSSGGSKIMTTKLSTEPSGLKSAGFRAESVDGTIAAIATPPGKGGIGIIRISGNQAQEIALRLFRPAKRTQDSDQPEFFLTPHRLHYGHIVDPATGRCSDEIMLAFMPGPRSYTREDVVEVQAHAGPAVLRKILTLIFENGARAAEPGEYTRRAFLNGRIDLTQAEAVADLICAENDSAAQLAAAQINGGLKSRIEYIIDAIDLLNAELEACIEFPQDVEESGGDKKVEHNIKDKIISPVEELIASYSEGRFLRDGIQITIVGRPNVGKSSLLNRLIAVDKAIVTAFPGTTRDPVEARAFFNGICLRFSDTAGIHASNDPVESIGIGKSKEAIDLADWVLLLIDAGEPSHPGDLEAYEACSDKRTLLVVNKIDLLERPESFELPDCFHSLPTHFVSALEGRGITTLKEKLLSLCVGVQENASLGGIVINMRHKQCLDAALEALERGLEGFKNGLPADLVSIDLRSAADALRIITGERLEDGLLDRIFERFCIGK